MTHVVIYDSREILENPREISMGQNRPTVEQYDTRSLVCSLICVGHKLN